MICDASAEILQLPWTLTHFAEILTNASDGVRKSAGMMAHSGTTFGAFGRFIEAAKTSLSVSSEGLILIYKLVNMRFENRPKMGLRGDPLLVCLVHKRFTWLLARNCLSFWKIEWVHSWVYSWLKKSCNLWDLIDIKVTELVLMYDTIQISLWPSDHATISAISINSAEPGPPTSPQSETHAQHFKHSSHNPIKIRDQPLCEHRIWLLNTSTWIPTNHLPLRTTPWLYSDPLPPPSTTLRKPFLA